MEHRPDIVSSEVAVLWNAYMQNTMAYCILQHFNSVNEDVDMEDVIQQALENCHFVVNGVKDIFEREKYALPFGFTEGDVNLNAPRVFSDLFALRYIKYTAAAGTAAAANMLELLARKDVRELFTQILVKFTNLYNNATDLLLKKGTFIRSPTIPPMEKAEYLQNESFLSGLLGRHRPLTVVELAHISKNTETNSIGRSLVIGFSQIAQLPEVQKYLQRGSHIAQKHETIFREILIEDGIPLPSTWDSTISSSTEPPFSDKLMMYQTSLLNNTSITAYGASIGGSMRLDLGAAYTRLMAEIAQYAMDGVKLMIDNRWLEQPPQNVDREALRKKEK
ncbi:hypothetical protein JOC77_001579 [Peribacillus deserti]|uniref:DUF3231 domain-containing protein n=1 Tax=Peribacillus deserti TaxID=673318 RepID=A0ABS2QG80_9BACI|nr:DUF3231 family protein [Peribacillus deserti]MBM7692152.1 hypothetical protein [Peribacillus deserti]